MKKILLSLLIVFIIYILVIFKLPSIAIEIGKFLGIQKFNELIEKLGGGFNNTVTDIPTSKEVLDVYNKTLSGANMVKGKLINKAEKTKGIVDDVRVSFSGSDEKIKDIKTTITTINTSIDETKDIINESIDNVGQIRGKIETINEILSNSGVKN